MSDSGLKHSDKIWDEGTWIDILKTRYPDTEIIVGKVGSIDNEGKAYITLTIGGKKKEGEEFPLWVTGPWYKDEVLQMWFDSFNKYAKGAKKIYIRRFPSLSLKNIKELDTFELTDKIYTQIVGRFSFHY